MTKFNLEALLFISRFGHSIKSSKIEKEFSHWGDLNHLLNKGLIVKEKINKKDWFILTTKGNRVIDTLTSVLELV